MRAHRTTARIRRRWAGFLFASMLLLAGPVSTSPAHADEPGETTVAYLLVQQALGHLAHDTTDEGVLVAMEKIDDALSTEDQEGVDVALLEQAQAALEAGQLQES